MAKQIKVWNGRAYCCKNWSDPRWFKNHFGADCAFVAAYSREDARRVIEEYCGKKPSVAELRDYWSPCWGNPMKGVEPERGLWIQFEHTQKPVRVY